MSNGNGGSGFTFDPSVFFQGIVNTIIAVINAIIAALVFLFNLLVSVFNFLFGGLQQVYGFSFDGIGKVWGSLKTVVDDLFKLKIFLLWKDFLTLLHNIKDFLKPLLDLIRKYRAMFDKYILGGLKRYLDLIQRLRKILVIFKLFHFKFAKRLDDKLVKLETKITGRLLAVRAELNKITNIITLVLDPELLIKREILFSSLGRGIDDLLKGITGKGTSFWFGLNPGGRADVTAILSSQKAVNDYNDATVNNVGPLYTAAQLTLRDYQSLVGG